MVRRVVELHYGDARALNRPDGGAAFTLVLSGATGREAEFIAS